MRLLPRIVEDADRAAIFDNTGTIPRVFAFHAGAPLASQDDIPFYLIKRLYGPLRERRKDAFTLTTLYPSLRICQESNEEAFQDGRVVWQSQHYVVTTDATGPIRHDRLLLEGLEGSVPNGAFGRIRYKDGAGAISLAS